MADKEPKTNKGTGKKKPGRPASDVPASSFCCRAPDTLIDAFEALAKAVRTKYPGTELLHAAEEHLKRMFRIIEDDPDSKLLDQTKVQAFLDAAEAYFKESKQWPLPDPPS